MSIPILNVNAQNIDCSALLKGGVFDYSSTISSTDNISRILSYLDKKKYNSTASMKKDARSFGMQLPEVGGFNVANNGEVSFNGKTYTSLTHLYETNTDFHTQFNNQITTASSSILQAFNQCIENTQGGKYRIWAKYDNNYTRVVVAIKREKFDPHIPVLKIKKIVSPDATPITDYTGEVIGNDPIYLTFNITNSTSDLLVFDIQTDDSTGSYRPHIEVEKIVEDPPKVVTPKVVTPKVVTPKVVTPKVVTPKKPTKLRVTTKTQLHKNANTCEQVWIYFNDLSTGWRLDLAGDTFIPGKIEHFYIDAGFYIGDIKTVTVVIKDSPKCDGKDAWKCEYLQIENLRSGKATQKIFINKTFDINSETKGVKPRYKEANIIWK
jgi:hypothetical protein